jgi:hypothetical protein
MATKAKPKGKQGSAKAKSHAPIIAAIVIIVAAIAAALLYNAYGAGGASFTTFKSTFNSAPRVGIYVVADNGTGLASTVGCATQLIEKIVATPGIHRNSSTIGFYVLNSTSCTYLAGGLGRQIKNYTYTSASDCINFSRSAPSIFLNYSQYNNTIIKKSAIYIEGNAAFMGECGIAYEIT